MYASRNKEGYSFIMVIFKSCWMWSFMVLVARINCIQIVLMRIKLWDSVCEKVYPCYYELDFQLLLAFLLLP